MEEKREKKKDKYLLMYGISLMVVGINSLILSINGIAGLGLSDMLIRILGVIGLVALPFLAFSGVKVIMRGKKK
mgnify:FL=1